MKLKLGNSIALSMVAMLFLSMMAIFPVHASPDHIYMTPSVNPPLPGPYVSFLWNITIWVTDYGTPPVFAWQVSLVYNPAAGINCTRAWVANFDPAYIFVDAGPGATVPVTSISPGLVMAGDSLTTQAGVVPPPDPAKLAIFEFHIIAAPEKYGELYTVLHIDDEQNTFLLDETLSSIPRTAADGSYSWVWTPPPPARVGVKIESATGDEYTVHIDSVQNPAQVTYLRGRHAPSNNITVGVYLKDYDALWGVTMVTFCLCFNSTLLEILGPPVRDLMWTSFGWQYIPAPDPHTELDELWVMVDNPVPPPPGPDVLLVTVIFHVIYQGEFPAVDTSPLHLCFYEAMDHFGPIDLDPPHEGSVIIQGYLARILPWFEVSSAVLGPDLVIGEQYGKEFEITIDIKGPLDPGWLMVGVQFRLAYDPELVKPVEVIEGPFLQDHTWNWYGTFPIAIYPEDPTPGCPSVNILLADMILPNPDTGLWDQPEPEGEGTLWIIRFKALKQSWVEVLSADLYVAVDFLSCWLVDEEANEIPVDEEKIVDGTVTILPIEPRGRWIDVWVFNPALGGQGIHEPADLVLPQMELTLTAKVTYNWQPVSYKKVTFEIVFISGEDPYLWAVLQDDTCDDGHAYVTFRMPWTGHGAEQWLGKWRVYVSVTLADVVISDYMDFDYDYLIRIFSVTTDKLEYYKCNDVKITVTYGTKSTRMHDVTMYATIQDELGVPIGIASLARTVGGGYFCHYKTFIDTVVIHVPTWAYAGLATVRVSFVSGLPSQGGEAVAQEFITFIWILPVHADDPWFEDP